MFLIEAISGEEWQSKMPHNKRGYPQYSTDISSQLITPGILPMGKEPQYSVNKRPGVWTFGENFVAPAAN